MRRIPKRLTQNARNLRNSATPEEKALWRILSSHRPRFTRQLAIYPYVADFACRKAKVTIELDGSQHLRNNAYDRRRTEYLTRRGWKELRFWNNEVRENANGVAEKILDVVAERSSGVKPRPVPPRKRKSRPEG